MRFTPFGIEVSRKELTIFSIIVVAIAIFVPIAGLTVLRQYQSTANSLKLPSYCTAYAGEVGAANSLTGDRPITQVAITCQAGSMMNIEDAGRTIHITPPAETK